MTDRTVERIARESYGRLLAYLCRRTHDLSAAEDALAEAFAAALEVWPRTGAPTNPEAWLFQAAKRKLIDAARRARTADQAAPEVERRIEEAAEAAASLPDERLGLMVACAHPAIEPGMRAALILQTLLGLTAERMAPAFLVEPATMGQRLARAKRKLADARLGFAVPDVAVWPERLAAVLEAIYAAYGQGWSEAGPSPRRALAEEAIWLAQALCSLLPGQAEALGLLSLMLHLEARRPARLDAEGVFAPLHAQDPRRWHWPLLLEAEAALKRAGALSRPGRFQLEAAIQSAHASRAFGLPTDWDAIVTLYEGLEKETGSPVALLNGLAARAQRDGAATALGGVEALAARLGAYQPFWALLAHLRAETGDAAGALAAFEEALARTDDPAVRAYLEGRRAGL